MLCSCFTTERLRPLAEAADLVVDALRLLFFIPSIPLHWALMQGRLA